MTGNIFGYPDNMNSKSQPGSVGDIPPMMEDLGKALVAPRDDPRAAAADAIIEIANRYNPNVPHIEVIRDDLAMLAHRFGGKGVPIYPIDLAVLQKLAAIADGLSKLQVKSSKDQAEFVMVTEAYLFTVDMYDLIIKRLGEKKLYSIFALVNDVVKTTNDFLGIVIDAVEGAVVDAKGPSFCRGYHHRAGIKTYRLDHKAPYTIRQSMDEVMVPPEIQKLLAQYLVLEVDLSPEDLKTAFTILENGVGKLRTPSMHKDAVVNPECVRIFALAGQVANDLERLELLATSNVAYQMEVRRAYAMVMNFYKVTMERYHLGKFFNLDPDHGVVERRFLWASGRLDEIYHNVKKGYDGIKDFVTKSNQRPFQDFYTSAKLKEDDMTKKPEDVQTLIDQANADDGAKSKRPSMLEVLLVLTTELNRSIIDLTYQKNMQVVDKTLVDTCDRQKVVGFTPSEYLMGEVTRIKGDTDRQFKIDKLRQYIEVCEQYQNLAKLVLDFTLGTTNFHPYKAHNQPLEDLAVSCQGGHIGAITEALHDYYDHVVTAQTHDIREKDDPAMLAAWVKGFTAVADEAIVRAEQETSSDNAGRFDDKQK